MNWKRELEQGVERMLRGMYVYVPAVLESVDNRGLGVVVKKDDGNVSAAEVPLFSLYAGDGYGESHALHPPEHGYMLCPKYPTDSTMAKEGVVDGVSHRRHYSFNDGHFIAGPRYHEFESALDSPIGAYHYRHESGAERYISESGNMRFTHPDGHEIALDSGTVSVEFAGSSARSLLLDENEIRGTVVRDDGDKTSLSVSETSVTFAAVDLYNDYATDPRTSVGVDESGAVTLDGRVQIGDTDAYRRDTDEENTDINDPRTYAEVDEPAAPIADPTDGSETAYTNPSTVEGEGPHDVGLYELRRAIPERREQDPDPTVTDPTNPAYVDLPDAMRSSGVIPVGYMWINTTEQALKMWGFAQTAVVIKSIA